MTGRDLTRDVPDDTDNPAQLDPAAFRLFADQWASVPPAGTRAHLHCTSAGVPAIAWRGRSGYLRINLLRDPGTGPMYLDSVAPGNVLPPAPDPAHSRGLIIGGCGVWCTARPADVPVPCEWSLGHLRPVELGGGIDPDRPAATVRARSEVGSAYAVCRGCITAEWAKGRLSEYNPL